MHTRSFLQFQAGRARLLPLSIVTAAVFSATGCFAQTDLNLVAIKTARIEGTLQGRLQMADPAANLRIDSTGRIEDTVQLPSEGLSARATRPFVGGIAVARGPQVSPGVSLVNAGGAGALKGELRVSNTFSPPSVRAPRAPSGLVDLYVGPGEGRAPSLIGLRNLTLAAEKLLQIPAGVYGDLSIENGQVALGASNRITRYEFRSLSIGPAGRLVVEGPVILTVGKMSSIAGTAGSSVAPLWLDLRVSSGAITLAGTGRLFGCVCAPSSQVTLESGAVFTGGLLCEGAYLRNGSRLVGVGPGWGQRTDEDGGPRFVHKMLRVENRRVDFDQVLGAQFETSISYDQDFPVLILTEKVAPSNRTAETALRRAIFEGFCTALEQTGFDRAEILVRRYTTGRAAPWEERLVLSRSTFADNLRTIGRSVDQRDNLLTVRSSDLLLNLFVERARTLGAGL